MKTYAIKTPKGYFARQGDQQWIQETPNGWGEFTEREHAQDVLDHYKPEGGKVVPGPDYPETKIEQ